MIARTDGDGIGISNRIRMLVRVFFNGYQEHRTR